MDKTKKGGSRKGSGAKIEKLGGLDAFKEKIIAYIERSCKTS